VKATSQRVPTLLVPTKPATRDDQLPGWNRFTINNYEDYYDYYNYADEVGKTSTTKATTTTTTAEETVILITGGYSSSFDRLSSTEIYPTDCSLPTLPSARLGHSTFATTGPSSKIVTCGGETTQGLTASCLVLDVENQLWEGTVVGDLTQPRSLAAPVTIENVGTYLIGGDSSGMRSLRSLRWTSDFLAAGSTEWAEGPALPVDMHSGCVVRISQLSFLIIYGNDILEYQVDTLNPTSSSGWQSASKFPQLQTSRYYQPGCSKIGDQVVIAGGFGSGYLRSTEVLNLTTRTIVYAGDMNSARAGFHMATITMNGQETLLAFGGHSGPSAQNSVEQFNTNNNTWTLAPAGMEEARFYFSTVIVPGEVVCPT
jgi:hypothetical protein